MKKYKRSNYLIDKPFQIGFIIRFIIIIIITIVLVFSVTALYYYVVSNFGEFKLNTSLTYTKRGYVKHQGNQVYNYDKEKIEVYEERDSSGNKRYIVFKTFGESKDKYNEGDVVNIQNMNDIEPKIGSLTKTTTRFIIIFYPLLITMIALIIIVSVFSLFFSHRVAGPIYRIKVSLDRMLEDDYDFVVRVRKNDFFINIVDRLEKLRKQLAKKKK